MSDKNGDGLVSKDELREFLLKSCDILQRKLDGDKEEPAKDSEPAIDAEPAGEP